MIFCLRHVNGLLPRPFIVWLVLSYWGDIVSIGNCRNSITLESSSSSYIGKTETIITGLSVRRHVFINTDKVRSNGLFYNVLLHELGHCHGYADYSSSPDNVMSYTVAVDNNTVLQEVQYVGMHNRFVPFSPFELFNFTGKFYDFFS